MEGEEEKGGGREDPVPEDPRCFTTAFRRLNGGRVDKKEREKEGEGKGKGKISVVPSSYARSRVLIVRLESRNMEAEDKKEEGEREKEGKGRGKRGEVMYSLRRRWLDSYLRCCQTARSRTEKRKKGE